METFDFQWKVMCGMRRVREYTEQALQPFCDKYSLSPIQLRVLVTLARCGPLTMTSLAKGSCIAGTNLSALCKQMAADGLLVRKRDECDERQVLVSLSERGEEITGALEDEFNNRFFPSANLSQHDMELIMDGMDRLLGMIETDKEKAS